MCAVLCGAGTPCTVPYVKQRPFQMLEIGGPSRLAEIFVILSGRQCSPPTKPEAYVSQTTYYTHSSGTATPHGGKRKGSAYNMVPGAGYAFFPQPTQGTVPIITQHSPLYGS